MKYLDELKKLNLPLGEFAIFGSGPIAIRGMREAGDIDIVVKKDLWNVLAKKYPGSLHSNPEKIQTGNIEIYNDWPNTPRKTNELVDSAEIIEGFPFVQLKYVIEWKKRRGENKDIKDLELIRLYNNQK